MPKEVSLEVGTPLSSMSDEELAEALESVKRLRAEMAKPVIDVDAEPKVLVDARNKKD